jgi:catechol 2,3-dioxygenase-like lactoylglutathione lyase family enzyme
MHSQEGVVIRHVAGIGEIVENVEAAVAFYRDVLGLDVEYDGDGEYADVKVPGILHYGLWDRRAAAESILGDRGRAGELALGFSLGFEVDSTEQSSTTSAGRGLDVIHSTRTEPWGQVVARFALPSGAVAEFSETPWARRISQPMQVGDE